MIEETDLRGGIEQAVTVLPILPACQLFASSRTAARKLPLLFRLGLSSYLDIHFVLTKRFDTAENVAEDRSFYGYVASTTDV